ncbi:unnamed protein product [Peniophora sp. CBMAI 1063]|nr:unnamed protein product [Peniophora sp. CBMAI 1063]
MSQKVDQHADTGPGTATVAVARSVDFWRSDRDLVLETTETQGNCTVHTMYGVLKSMLTTISESFRDAFDGGPQDAFLIGPDSSGTYEKLPVMHLTDNGEDVVEFLRMTHYGWYLSKLKRLERDPRHGLLRVPGAYYGLLRMAQKYMAHECTVEIVDTFHEVWPTHLHTWLNKETARLRKVYESAPASLTNAHPDTETGTEPEEWDQTELLPDPISTYIFASQHHPLQGILPAVAYDIAHSHTVSTPLNDGGFRRLDFTLLSPQDAADIRAGAEVLRLDCIRKLDFDLFAGISLRPDRCLFTPGGAAYADDLACFDGLRKFWVLYVVPLVSLARPIDLLRFPTAEECLDHLEDVCDACASAVIDHLENAKYMLWIKLPIYFRLVPYVSANWGFGPNAEARFEALPRLWQREVQAVSNLAQRMDEGDAMFQQLRNGPLL